MNWFFIGSVLIWVFGIVYIWCAKKYIREEMQICRQLQNDCWDMYNVMRGVIDTQRNQIKGWKHKIDIMDRDIRKLKQKGDTDV